MSGTEVTVVNHGNLSSGGFDVSISGPNVQSPERAMSPRPLGAVSVSFGRLEPGARATRTFGRCFPGTVKAVADSGDSVRESDESNNISSALKQTCPDLIVTSITSTDVTIENVGDDRAGPFSVTLSVGPTAVNEPGLAAGASKVIDLGGCFVGPITVTVDSGGSVLESDEGNDSTTDGPFTCALPDLVIAQLDGLGFTVANQGTAPAAQFDVSVPGVSTFSVSGIPAGGQRTVTFLSCVTGTVTAIADPANLVAESNENNNQLSALGACPALPQSDLVITAYDGGVVTVANVGTGPSDPTTVSVGNGSLTFAVGVLPAGGSQVIPYGNQCVAFTLNSLATVDPANDVKELDENNNDFVADVDCPDLQFDEYFASGGEAFVTVINDSGMGSAGPFHVSVSGLGTFSVPGILAPNATFDIDVGTCGPPDNVGNGNRDIDVDINNEVGETFENNSYPNQSQFPTC